MINGTEAHGPLDKQVLVDLIKKDIANLYKAAIQYNTHAAMIKGAHWEGYVKDLSGHAGDDFYQAQLLSEKLEYHFEECPYQEVPPTDSCVGKSSLQMIEDDLNLQTKAEASYKERIYQLMESGYPALANEYQKMLSHEEEHKNTTESFLFSYTTENDQDRVIQLRLARLSRKRRFSFV
jgi:bacterioferritin (cytochrome b1)